MEDFLKRKNNARYPKRNNSKSVVRTKKSTAPVVFFSPVSENPPKGPLAVKNQCVGILREQGIHGVVEPDPGYNGKQYGKVYIPHRDLNGAPFGMKVVCEIQNPEEASGNYQGKILEVLGDPMRHDVAILSIMRQFGLKETFSDAVQEEALKVPSALSAADIKDALAEGRRDLRGLPTITIDGEDAKDLDDAISIEALENGVFRLFVHIADVSHYVKDLSVLDTEALLRGTSVYLVDRVIPMLPPRLSNSICSLNPNAPRFTLTAEMDVDSHGNVVRGDIYESVIESDARTSYKGIQAMLDGEKKEELLPFSAMIENMKSLTDILIEKRNQRGALSFSFPETHVRLDNDGKPVEVYAYPIFYSNRMIEEFMILSNEFVAETFYKMEYPFIYRVHEDPNPEKIQTFTDVARLFGAEVKMKGKPTPKSLSVFLEKMKDDPILPALSHLLLRSLAKAEYNKENLEHFGLASACYCHFTSPIRRYPDLYIHRIIKSYLHKKRKKKYFSEKVQEISRHASEMERNSIDAERASVDLKAAEYMKEHLGEEFPGRISGIFHAGIFVQLENTIEGMVPFRTMDDFYSVDERTLEAKGKRSGKTFRIGDEVMVQVVRADPLERNIDFIFPEMEKSGDKDFSRRPSRYSDTKREHTFGKSRKTPKGNTVRKKKKKEK